jgi:hypothetical protein
LETAFECVRDWDSGTAEEARRAFDAAVCKAVQSATTFFRPPPQALTAWEAANQGRKKKAAKLDLEAREAFQAVRDAEALVVELKTLADRLEAELPYTLAEVDAQFRSVGSPAGKYDQTEETRWWPSAIRWIARRDGVEAGRAFREVWGKRGDAKLKLEEISDLKRAAVRKDEDARRGAVELTEWPAAPPPIPKSSRGTNLTRR